MEDEDNLKTPDAYVRNSGVDVEDNVIDPQYGRVKIRIRHNQFQCTVAQIGLEQAKELHEKLGALIEELAPKFGVGSRVRVSSRNTTFHNRTGVIDTYTAGEQFPLRVVFDDGGSCPFRETELEVL
jgi:hypothetical protein